MATPPQIERAPLLNRDALATLLVGNGLTEAGIAFFLPILPLFLSSRGGSPLFVGVMFASGIAGRSLAQYPGGRLADHFGARRVMVLAMVAYALLFPAYLLPVPVPALLPLRFGQAFCAGFYLPAAATLLAELTPPESRGRAFGHLRASDMAGLLLGPLFGGLVASFRLEAVFLASGVICLAAALLLLRLPAVSTNLDAATAEGPQARPVLRRILPMIALGAPITFAFGNYDAIWSLYMTRAGATRFQVGLSFALYALPILLLSGLAGGLGDRIGARRAARISVTSYAFFNALYPLISSVGALIGLGVVEGSLTAAGTPALSAEVSRAAPAGQQGRTQGLYQTGLTVAEAVGAVVGGGLYTLRPAFAFWGVSAVCLLGVLLSFLLWRGRLAPPA